MMRAILFVLFPCFLVLLVACGEPEKEEKMAAAPEEPTPVEVSEAKEAELPFEPVEMDLGDGLKATILRPGEGDIELKPGDRPLLKTVLRDEEGAEIWSGDFEFVIDSSQAIPGFDRGVRGMKPGEERRIYVPWQLGYGEKENGPIKARQNLVFEVELITINP